VREFYSASQNPVVVGIEATGSMQWLNTAPGQAQQEIRVDRPVQCFGCYLRAGENAAQQHRRDEAKEQRSQGQL
jgi:hypothetical protein